MIDGVKCFGKIKEYTAGMAKASIALWILSIMQRIAWSVMCLALKPSWLLGIDYLVRSRLCSELLTADFSFFEAKKIKSKIKTWSFVLHRKWSPHRKLPHVDRKWSRRKTRNDMEFVPLAKISIFILNRNKPCLTIF